jgi:hypothetical protein
MAPNCSTSFATSIKFNSPIARRSVGADRARGGGGIAALSSKIGICASRYELQHCIVATITGVSYIRGKRLRLNVRQLAFSIDCESQCGAETLLRLQTWMIRRLRLAIDDVRKNSIRAPHCLEISDFLVDPT